MNNSAEALPIIPDPLKYTWESEDPRLQDLLKPMHCEGPGEHFVVSIKSAKKVMSEQLC